VAFVDVGLLSANGETLLGTVGGHAAGGDAGRAVAGSQPGGDGASAQSADVELSAGGEAAQKPKPSPREKKRRVLAAV
jgi:hypothetical protein